MWYTKDLIALKLDKLLNNLESKTGQARQIKKKKKLLTELKFNIVCNHVCRKIRCLIKKIK